MYKVFALVLLLGTTSVMADEGLPLSDNPFALDDERACGPLCVGFLDQYFGGNRTYKEIVSLCPPGALGINLQQAETALRECGYHTRSVHLTVETLKRLQWPCMLYQQNANGVGHFLVCTRWQPEHGTFQVFNPPWSLEEVSSEFLEQQMQGLAIVVYPEPLPPVEQLVPNESSWQFSVAIEVVVIGLLFVVFGRRRSKTTGSALSGNSAAVVLALTLLTYGCSNSTRDGPQLATDGRTIDLGDVIQGTALKATFQVRNDGNAPFRIENVERTCQCQNVRFDATQEIPPGGTATISVVMQTKDMVGPQTKHLIVRTTAEDSDHAAITLTLKAKVRALLQAIPSQIMFGSVSGEGASRQLRIVFDSPELADKYQSLTAPDFLEVDLLKQNKDGLLFNVRLLPETPKGVLSGSIGLRFEIPELSELWVPVLGRKVGPLTVVPAKLSVNGRVGQQTVKILIQSTTGQTFRLLSALTPPGATPVWKNAKTPQKQFLIDVLISSPEAIAGKTIVFKTDLASQQTIQVPILVRE